MVFRDGDRKVSCTLSASRLGEFFSSDRGSYFRNALCPLFFFSTIVCVFLLVAVHFSSAVDFAKEAVSRSSRTHY